MRRNKKYWESRYSSGGESGLGSVDENRHWKWSVIEKYLNSYNEIIDVGCGDITFWKGRNCDNYTGLDISSDIIKKNQIQRPEWDFLVSSAEKRLDIKADVVFCLDILFHIMDNQIYKETIVNLCNYSKKWIFIFTWEKNPFEDKRYRAKAEWNITKNPFKAIKRYFTPSNTDHHYQYYRDFIDYMPIFAKHDFELVKIHSIPYPPSKSYPKPIGAMYVFRRKT